MTTAPGSDVTTNLKTCIKGAQESKQNIISFLHSTMSQRKSIADSTKSILAEKLDETVTISRDAITSGGWSYPFLGILYFASHPSLYRAVAPVLIKCLVASLGITGGLFIFTYLPQVAFCALFSGPFAFITAAVMVLGEAYAIILVVSKAFFLGASSRPDMCVTHVPIR